MTAPEPDAAGLAGLRERLRGGVHDTVADGRPGDLDFRDERTLRDWPGDTFRLLAGLRDDSWAPGDEPFVTILDLTARMGSQRPFLAAVLFSPHLVLNRLLESCGSAGKGLADTWIGLCWTAEAAWCAVKDELPGDPAGPAAGDAALLRPLAARLRFLVLSEPMRWQGTPDRAWWGWPDDQVFGGSGVLDRVLGPETWRLLAGRGQEARRNWQGFLDAYQSHPLLSQARPEELEQELRTLVFRQPEGGSSWRPAAPLGLSAQPLSEPVTLTAEDKSVIADVTERHLLPRFSLPDVVRLALYDDNARWRRTRILTGIAVALAGLAAVGCAAALLVDQATIIAAACYLLICAGAVILPAGWSQMWLLRMPAASAVGVIALISFLPGGWLITPPGGWRAAIVLAAVSAGYLVIEVRNHGAARAAAVPRALLVVVTGAVHALMVSLIGLVVVAPAFVADGASLAALWRRPAYGHAGMVLALATAWCLAVGVFSQILWDDRPITAPLAHLSWRGR